MFSWITGSKEWTAVAAEVDKTLSDKMCLNLSLNTPDKYEWVLPLSEWQRIGLGDVYKLKEGQLRRVAHISEYLVKTSGDSPGLQEKLALLTTAPSGPKHKEFLVQSSSVTQGKLDAEIQAELSEVVKGKVSTQYNFGEAKEAILAGSDYSVEIYNSDEALSDIMEAYSFHFQDRLVVSEIYVFDGECTLGFSKAKDAKLVVAGKASTPVGPDCPQVSAALGGSWAVWKSSVNLLRGTDEPKKLVCKFQKLKKKNVKRGDGTSAIEPAAPEEELLKPESEDT
mmetsp:Transcript_6063/g.13213  ORF Transcript_6063/g.13213 Transcript_6063/m.13213 type:complete len:282 (-) Transcript_6063:71-916(-)